MASLHDLLSGSTIGLGGGGSFNEAAAGKNAAQPLAGADGDWFAQFNPSQASPNTGITGGGGAQGGDWISQALSQAQSTDDPNYWRGVIAADPKVAAGDQSAIDYWKMRIAQGDGAAATRNGQQQPYGSTGGGVGAGSLLASVPTVGDLQNMPGYQAQLDAAQRAVQRSAAAKGTLLSGGTLEDLQNAAIGTAMGNYLGLSNLQNGVKGQNFNQLYNLSSLGLNATNAATNAGSSYAANSANLATGQGNANAAAGIAQGNNNAGVINSLGQLGASFIANRNPNNGGGLIYGPGY